MRFTVPLVIALLVGCAQHEHLPPVAWHTDADALHSLADRATRVHTVTAQGLLTMQQPNGQSVRLDIAMVRDNARHLRLRAWKLGRAVFDFTVTPDGVWLLMPDDPSIRDRVSKARSGVTKLADTFSILDGALFSNPKAVLRDTGKMLICTALIDAMQVHCEIDRDTLVPRTYIIKDDQGIDQFKLALAGYHMIGDLPFAELYTATSDMGTMIISLNDIELNTDLAPAAFIPPHRAEKVR